MKITQPLGAIHHPRHTFIQMQTTSKKLHYITFLLFFFSRMIDSVYGQIADTAGAADRIALRFQAKRFIAFIEGRTTFQFFSRRKVKQKNPTRFAAL